MSQIPRSRARAAAPRDVPGSSHLEQGPRVGRRARARDALRFAIEHQRPASSRMSGRTRAGLALRRRARWWRSGSQAVPSQRLTACEVDRRLAARRYSLRLRSHARPFAKRSDRRCKTQARRAQPAACTRACPADRGVRVSRYSRLSRSQRLISRELSCCQGCQRGEKYSKNARIRRVTRPRRPNR